LVIYRGKLVSSKVKSMNIEEQYIDGLYVIIMILNDGEEDMVVVFSKPEIGRHFIGTLIFRINN